MGENAPQKQCTGSLRIRRGRSVSLREESKGQLVKKRGQRRMSYASSMELSMHSMLVFITEHIYTEKTTVIIAMTAMKHQKKYIELEQVIYNTCFDDELWVVYAWYGAMRSNAQECVRDRFGHAQTSIE